MEDRQAFLFPGATTEPRRNEHSYMRELARLPSEFSYEDLKDATNNFQAEEKLGSGGSGSVFKGTLKDGTLVAVKKVELSQFAKIQFEAEISTIASLHHKHLVRIRGYAREIGGAFYVVYDLLAKGSLDMWIFPKSGGPTDRYLSWEQRYQVAIGVAKALVYLHQDCVPPILHLDVKPENILLDDKFHPVLADFGLSKLTREEENEVCSKMVRGTRGYMAPESHSGLTSEKIDIYSYGKVLFDLFFGQRYVCLDQNGDDIYEASGNSQREHRVFHSFMRTRVTHGNVVDLVDKRLKVEGKVDAVEAKTLLDVALCCLEEDSKKRPHSMEEVLRMLVAGKQNKDDDEPMVRGLSKELCIQKSPEGGLEDSHLEGKYSLADSVDFLTQESSLKDLHGEAEVASSAKTSLDDGSASCGDILPEGPPSHGSASQQMQTGTPKEMTDTEQQSLHMIKAKVHNKNDLVGTFAVKGSPLRTADEMVQIHDTVEHDKSQTSVKKAPEGSTGSGVILAEIPSNEGCHADAAEYNLYTGVFLHNGTVVVIVHKASHIREQHPISPIYVEVTLNRNGKNDVRKYAGEIMNGSNVEWRQEFHYLIEKGTGSGYSQLYFAVLSQLETIGHVSISLETLLEKKHIHKWYRLNTGASTKVKHSFMPSFLKKKGVVEDPQILIEMKWIRQ